MMYLKYLQECWVQGNTSMCVSCFTLEIKLDFSAIVCNSVSLFNCTENTHNYSLAPLK